MGEDEGGVRELKRALTDHNSGSVLKGALTDYDDIICEILARLPVKSLMRFRCVCKSWRALVAGSYFVKKHFLYQERGISHNTSRLLFSIDPPQSIDYEALKDLEEDGDGQFANRELHFPVRIPDYSTARKRIVGSCNGLVCVEIDGTGIVLWNPCTRDFKVLPSPPTKFHSFDLYGFGYDSTTDDYKVIKGRHKVSLIRVFTLKNGSWMTLCNHKAAMCSGQGSLVNGALHWFVPGLPSKILSFDLAEETFEEIGPLPDRGYLSRTLILIHRNCLCLYRTLLGLPGVLIWMMKEYGVNESWTQVIQLSLETCPEAYLRLLCILENGEILIHSGGSVLLLNDQKTLKKVFEADLRYGAAIYKETLVSPVTGSIADI